MLSCIPSPFFLSQTPSASFQRLYKIPLSPSPQIFLISLAQNSLSTLNYPCPCRIFPTHHRKSSTFPERRKTRENMHSIIIIITFLPIIVIFTLAAGAPLPDPLEIRAPSVPVNPFFPSPFVSPPHLPPSQTSSTLLTPQPTHHSPPTQQQQQPLSSSTRKQSGR